MKNETQKGSKTYKRLKERFRIRRNRTKRANFRGSPLFSSYVQHKNRRKENNNKQFNLSCVSWMWEAGGRKRSTFASLFQLYSVEEVLTHVRRWHDSVRSPLSTFYLFVLLSLMGFGTTDRPGMRAKNQALYRHAPKNTNKIWRRHQF